MIYGWNGASHERIEDFRVDFDAELIQLYQNFRCPVEVVELANKLISHNQNRTANKKPLEAMKVMDDLKSQHIFIKKYVDFEDESSDVSRLILKIKEQYPNDSICVLARTNRLLDKAFDIAVNNGINCVKSKRKDEFEMPYVLWVYDMLKLANHRNDTKTLMQLITLINTISGKSIVYDDVLLQAEIKDGDLLKALCGYLIDAFEDTEFQKSILMNLCEGKNFLSFIKDAFNWIDNQINAIDDNEVREQTLSEYNAEKKVWIHFQTKLEYIYNLEEMTISTYMQEFSMISKEIEPSEDCIQFLTIHASKGKEFDNVILIGMVNDELPSFQSIKKGINSVELEEERRNCFVAITRSKKRLFMTYSDKYFGWHKKVSMFLIEMFQE